jgi:CRP/FNR family transcriptional regulator
MLLTTQRRDRIPEPIPPAKNGCPTCWVRHLCMAMDKPARETLERIDALIQHRPPIRKGDHLYRAGEACAGIHIVQTGLVRKFSLTPDGTERVIGFHMGADVLGLEALDNAVHRFNAQALDTTSVCLLPTESLKDIACHLTPIFHQLIRMLAYAEYQASRGILALQGLPAEVRVIGFLLRLSQRYQARGMNSREFPMRVPRQDLANYLGLNPATVSRVLTRLEREGLIARQAQHQLVCLPDPEGLRAKARGYEAFF